MNKKAGVFCLLTALFLPPSVGLSQQAIRWEPTLESAQRIAGQTNRLVLIEFWAPWCGVCKRMEAELLTQPAVVSLLNEKFVPVKINADNFPETARRYGIARLPATIITTPDGQPVETIVGMVDTAAYIERISRVAAVTGQRLAARNSLPSAATAPTDTRSPNSAMPVDTPRYDSFITNQTTTAGPSLNPPGPASSQPSRYGQPPTGYAPPQEKYSPPTGNAPQEKYSPPTASIPSGPPTHTYPPAGGAPTNVQPPRYGNPPPTYGQSPSQTPVAPAYGAQTPPAAPSQQPTVPPYSPPPVAAAQPSVVPNAPAPAGNPPLCLDGFCPVTLGEKQQWAPGDSRWGAIHRGRTYLFVGPEEQRRFFNDPDRYAPVGSGNDVVLAAEQGRAVPGLREHGVFFGGRVYLFSSEESLAKFAQKPDAYADQVLNATRSGAAAGRQLQ